MPPQAATGLRAVSAGGHDVVIDLDALNDVQSKFSAVRRLNRQLLGGADWAPTNSPFAQFFLSRKHMLFVRAKDSPVVEDSGEKVPFEKFEQTATGFPSASATWDAGCLARQCHRLQHFYNFDFEKSWFWNRWLRTPESFAPLANSTPPPEYDGTDR
jgi:hypothetical protein